jgi:broad specificity phosphatase PhoE
LRIKPLEELTEAKLKPDFVGKGGRHHILTDPEAYSETNMELLDRTERAIHIIIKEVDGNAIVVSRGDVNNAMLEDMVERRVSAEKYYVLDTDPAALSILKIKEQPILVLYNFHCKMFAEF